MAPTIHGVLFLDEAIGSGISATEVARSKMKDQLYEAANIFILADKGLVQKASFSTGQLGSNSGHGSLPPLIGITLLSQPDQC